MNLDELWVINEGYFRKNLDFYFPLFSAGISEISPQKIRFFFIKNSTKQLKIHDFKDITKFTIMKEIKGLSRQVLLDFR